MIPLLFSLGCTGAEQTSDIVPVDTGPTGFPPLGADLIVTDADNHQHDAQWVLPFTPVRSNLDTNISWEGLEADAYGVARPADAYQGVLLFKIAASRIDIPDLLAIDQLDPVVLDSWSHPTNGLTEIVLSDISGFDPDVQMQVDPDVTWLLALAVADGDRFDIRAGLTMQPAPKEVGFLLTVPNNAARYEWTNKIEGALRTSADHADYPLDWSGLTTDGYGQPFDPGRVDELFFGRYDDVDEADDLSSRILDLQATATEWSTLPVSGGATSANLADFPGFSGLEPGTSYLVGGRCTTCLGPVPLWTAGIDVQ